MSLLVGYDLDIYNILDLLYEFIEKKVKLL